jgi:cytochrome c oxidase cbb3-type subunit IV
MDYVNDLRSIMTVLTFLSFLGIVWWAYSGRRKAAYEEAAQLALDDDAPYVAAGAGPQSHPDK